MKASKKQSKPQARGRSLHPVVLPIPLSRIGDFKITIDDGFCAYTYLLRPASKRYAICDVYRKLCKAFAVDQYEHYGQNCQGEPRSPAERKP